MKLDFYDETIKPIVNYLGSILQEYMETDQEEMFSFLCNHLQDSVEPTVRRIKTSLEFLSFYFSIANIGKSKIKIKREDVYEAIVEYREVLKGFLRNESLPENILEDSIYSVEMIKNDEKILKTLPVLYDNNNTYLKRFQKELNKVLIESILNIAELLENIGILAEYHKFSCKKNKEHHLDKISIEMGEPKKIDFMTEFMKYFQESKTISCPKNVYEIFSLEYLNSLKTEKLVFINLFWSNKMAKVFMGMMKILIFFQRNKSLMKGLKRGDVSLKTLNFYAKDFKGEYYWDILKDAYEGNDIEDQYLRSDIDSMLPLYEFLKMTYVLKDLCIFSALESEGKDKSIKNYGIINEYEDGRIILAWDIPKMNLPITVHLNVDSIKYYYTNINPQEKIREYIGSQDFFETFKAWKNSLLYEISSDKVEYIKSKTAINNQIKHVLFIQTGIFPEHMRENGKVQKKFIQLDKLGKNV